MSNVEREQSKAGAKPSSRDGSGADLIVLQAVGTFVSLRCNLAGLRSGGSWVN